MEESKLRRKESILYKILLKPQDKVEIKCLEFGEVVMRKGCTVVRRLHLEILCRSRKLEEARG